MDKSDRERRASRLEAEAKQLRRQEKGFWDEVEKRWDEIQGRCPTTWSKICSVYEITTREEMSDLYSFLISDKVREYKKECDTMITKSSVDDMTQDGTYATYTSNNDSE